LRARTSVIGLHVSWPTSDGVVRSDWPTLSYRFSSTRRARVARRFESLLSRRRTADHDPCLEREARRLVDRHFREGILRDALASATDHVAWILIDCPPSLGILVENAIVAANRVIVPVRSEARGADGLVDLLEVMEELNRTVLPATRILRTMRHGGHTTANTLIDDDLEDYPERLFETVIPDCLDLNQRAGAQPGHLYFAPRSTGAAAYTQLAVFGSLLAAELARKVQGTW
jgi:cellulose biosynthesis protein BcsQ